MDENGFVLDYNDLKAFQKNVIDNHLDHRHLNDVLGCSEATTAEALAEYLYNCTEAYLAHVLGVDGRVYVLAIEVQETPKTCARYEP